MEDVADLRHCVLTFPHGLHGWTEPGTGYDGKFWHICEGVEALDGVDE